MLKALRQNLRYLHWILWLVIAVFVIFIFLDFGTGVGNFGGGNQANAATVGGERITRVEFQRAYRRMEDQARQLYGEQFTPEVATQLRLPVRALDELITRRILLDEARRLGLRATDGEVRRQILADGSFKDESGRFVGDETYRQILGQMGTTRNAYEREVREQVLLEKLVNTLRANLWVSDQEVERSYREQVEKAKIKYLVAPRNQFAQAADVPQGEVAAYFNSHKEELRLPAQREVAYLTVESAKLLPQVNEDEAAMRRYYQEHIQEYTQQEQARARHILAKVDDEHPEAAARARIEQARRRIEGGEDFAKVAGELSEDEGSKASGGDLGLFGRDQMVKEFSDAAFAAEPGKLVGPVRSDYGFHLIEVTEKRPAGQRTFEQVRGEIGGRLVGERVREIAEAKARELSQRLIAEKPKGPEALEALAKQDPTLTYALSGKFGQSDPIPGIGPAPGFTGAAFALEKGKVSEPVQVPRGWAVLYLKDVHEPRVPELSEVEPRVRALLARQKQEALAMDRLKRARSEMAAGKSLEDVAKELGTQVQESPEFGAQGMIPGLGMSSDLARAALALQPGQAGGPVAAGPGAVLFEVTERKSWNPQEFQANREATRERLEQEQLGRLLASLLEQRRRDLGVEYDRELLQSLGLTGEPDAES